MLHLRARRLILATAVASGLAQTISGTALARVDAPAPAPGAAQATPAIPAATQHCINQFMAMLNDPSPERVQAFEDEFGSAERRRNAGVAQRIKNLTEGRAQRGEIALNRIISAAPNAVTLLVDSTRDEPLYFEFQFSESETGKLDGVMISPAREHVAAQTIDRQYTAATVEAAAKALEEGYVFPEVASKMAALVRENLAKGEYDAITDEVSLNRRLTKDLRSISNDKHLGVRLEPKREGRRDGPSAEEIAGENYAFRKVEVLHGGIGYLKFDAFLESPEAEKKASEALAFLAGSRALIIDLRENGGGSPEMIRFITSYFFSQRTHLNDMVDRNGKVVEEYWTLDTVPGKRFADDLPIIVLTSGRTFSGAEEFSYNLKNLKRATIIGETTGGGAHPVQGVRLNERTVIGVPFMRAQNPITKINWEGTGVKPDIEVPASEALDKALDLAKWAIEQKPQPKG